MPKIPEFERRQLASSVVGTPGEDQSGQMIFNSVAQNVNKATAAFSELHKERERVKNDTLVAKSQIDFLRNIEDETLRHEQEYSDFRGDARERSRAYDEKIQRLFNDQINAIPSDEARIKFEREGYGIINQARIREMKQASQQQALLAHQDTLTGINELAIQASKLGGNTNVDFQTKMSQLEYYQTFAKNLIDKSSRNLTPEDKYTLETAYPESILKGYAASAVVNAPHELLQAIDSGKFDKLKPQERESLRSDAIKSLKNLEEQGKYNDLLSNIQGHFDVLDKVAKGDPSAMIDIENLPDTPQNKTLKDLILTAPIGPVDQVETQFDLLNKMRDLEIDAETKTSKANAEALLSFMGDVVQAARDGKITKSIMSDYMKKTATPFYDKVKNPGKNSFQSSLASAWNAIVEHVPALGGFGKIEKKQAVGIYRDFELILSKQKDINSQTVASALNQALKLDAIRRHPTLLGIEGTVTDIRNSNGTYSATGIPGTATKKADKKISTEKTIRIRAKNGKIYPLSEKDAKEFIDAGYEVVK